MPHIHDKIDYTVDVYVVNGDAVLLRKHDKYKMWLVPGGHIELDETPEAAGLREVKEEVGLDVQLVGEVPQITEAGTYQELLPPRFMNIHPISDTHQHLSLVYFATSSTRDTFESDHEKSEGLHWFTAAELDDPSWGIQEAIRHYAKAALRELGA